MAKHNEIGKIGEEIAVKFLKKKDFSILETNYWKPYGEIDIVAREKNGLVRFVEVKSVSYETGTGPRSIRPEENMHPQKMKRLARVIEAYIVSHETGEWVFDLICVYVDPKTRSAQVKWLKDIVLA